MVGGRIETMVKAMTQAQSIDAFKKLTKSFKNQFKATYVSGALNQCAYNMNLKICILELKSANKCLSPRPSNSFNISL